MLGPLPGRDVQRPAGLVDVAGVPYARRVDDRLAGAELGRPRAAVELLDDRDPAGEHDDDLVPGRMALPRAPGPAAVVDHHEPPLGPVGGVGLGVGPEVLLVPPEVGEWRGSGAEPQVDVGAVKVEWSAHGCHPRPRGFRCHGPMWSSSPSDPLAGGGAALGHSRAVACWHDLRPRDAAVSAEDLERYETESELQLYQEYRAVLPMFKYVVETERRFYLANEVKMEAVGEGSRTFFEIQLGDAWVWDMYRPARFVSSVRVVTFKDVNVEELPEKEL